MPQPRDAQASASPTARRGGGRAAVVYGLIGVLTVIVVHATLDRDAAPTADGAVPAAVAKTAVNAAPTAQGDTAAQAAVAEAAAVTDAVPLTPDTLVVSASPRRLVRVGIQDNVTAVTNPLLRRSRPVPTELLAAAQGAAADDLDVLALPGTATSRAKIAPLSRHLSYGRLYGAPGGSRTVYLIDASGSQVDTLPFVQQAMQKALRSLKPEQSYTVIFFNGQGVTEAAPAGMTVATTAAVTQTDRFIDPQAGEILAAGRPDARAAIRRALAYQPDTVVLLSDGLTGRRNPLGDRASLLSLIDTANVSGARFHTIQVRQADPLASSQRRGTLELIASRTGGVYRFVPDEALPVR